MFSSCFPDLETQINDEREAPFPNCLLTSLPIVSLRYELNSSTMYRHWALQPLAFMAFLFALGFSKLNELPTDFCRDPISPPALVKMAIWAGVCLPYTKVHIPSVLTSWELQTLQPVASILPDPTEMVKNRVGKTFKIYVCLLRRLTDNTLEIGKISAALAGIGTPESELMMDAIENYDAQAKATIRSLSKLSYASTVWKYHHVCCPSRLLLE